MAYIDTKYIGECEFCRHHRHGGCDTWCENGECFRPDMSKIPTADVAEDIFKRLYQHIKFDGHTLGVWKNDLLCIAKEYDVNLE